jgi:hypothetical protein
MPDSPIIFDDVEVVSDTDMTMTCFVQGKVVMVGRSQPMTGTTIRQRGDRGRLVLPRWAVGDLGLHEPGSRG